MLRAMSWVPRLQQGARKPWQVLLDNIEEIMDSVEEDKRVTDDEMHLLQDFHEKTMNDMFLDLGE